MSRAVPVLVGSAALLVLGVLEVSIWSIALGALMIAVAGVGLVYGFDHLPRRGSTGGPSRRRESTGKHPRIPVANHDAAADQGTSTPKS